MSDLTDYIVISSSVFSSSPNDAIKDSNLLARIYYIYIGIIIIN